METSLLKIFFLGTLVQWTLILIIVLEVARIRQNLRTGVPISISLTCMAASLYGVATRSLWMVVAVALLSQAAGLVAVKILLRQILPSQGIQGGKS